MSTKAILGIMKTAEFRLHRKLNWMQVTICARNIFFFSPEVDSLTSNIRWKEERKTQKMYCLSSNLFLMKAEPFLFSVQVQKICSEDQNSKYQKQNKERKAKS